MLNQLGINSATGFVWILNLLIMFGFIAFWVAVIWLIVWAVRRSTEARGGSNVAGKSPLDIAKDRYARGEITKEQFDQLKKDLS